MRSRWPILRADAVEGMGCPVFIRNGHWFLTDFQAYPDGVFGCWEGVDLALLKQRVAEEWVQLSARIGSRIGIHGLGNATVDGGLLRVSPEDFLDWIQRWLKDVNTGELVDLQDRQFEEVEGVQWGRILDWNGRPFRDEPDPGPDQAKTFAEMLYVLRRREEDFQVVQWSLFSDGKCQLDHEQLCAPERVFEQLRAGELCTQAPDGSYLDFDQLGRYRVTDAVWYISAEDLIAEAKDTLDKLSGGGGAGQRCREALEAYTNEPTPETLERLRSAYEAVPRQLRPYIGDQDTQDIPIRMILYGDQEIENWVHWIVCQAEGLPLPTIVVPRIDPPA